tara:strand:- start:182 stop:457 length:276 start_codon:yes stop_codon:yes gene_type:complete
MKLTKQRIKEIIKEELEGMNEEPVEEGNIQEGFGPDEVDLVIRAITKLMTSPYTGPLFAAFIAGVPILAAHEKRALEKLKKDQPPVDGGDM